MAINYTKLQGHSRDETIKRKLELKGKPEKEQKVIKEYRLRVLFSSYLTLLTFFLVFICGVIFIKMLPYLLVRIILYFAAFVLSCFAASLPARLHPGGTQRTYVAGLLKKECIEYCKKHREFYGLTQDYIITACYHCFDEAFSRKTICLFRKPNKLCFTADIVNGFLNSKCDLGMYEIDCGSFEVERISFNDRMAYKITIDGKEVIFAQRAKKLLYNAAQSK